ncbi:MAG: glycoside hydrolase family 16 protein [Actinomycetota bacterium]
MRTTSLRGPVRRALIGMLGGALLLVGISLTTGSAADASVSGIQGVVEVGPTRVEGVKVDLFLAGADGSRGRYLRDARTDRNGWYWFDVSDGCYVITMVAPDNTTFTDTGHRWHQRAVCVSGGRSADYTNARLNGSGSGGGGGDDGGSGGGNGGSQPSPPPACTGAGNPIWELQFQDFFDGNGSNLGPEWEPYYSTGNAGYGLRRPSAISKWNGTLNIRASMQNGTLVSGGMRHVGEQMYGRYEFRVRTDQDWSEGTSGVVLTWPVSQRHPWDGENNIYETLATPGDRHEFYTFIHEPQGTVHDQDYTVHPVSANQWHTMVMEWTPDKIVIMRDGQVVKTIRETSENLIPDNPHFLAIQLDGWKHSIDRDVWMQVDYVKVWSYEGLTTC